MKILTCPVNGPRPIQEFTYGGPVRKMPDAEECSDEDWAEYVFNREGAPGIRREWWYHGPSAVWFVAERDIVKDEVLRSYLWRDRGKV